MSRKNKLLAERIRQSERVLTNYARSLKLIGLDKCIHLTFSIVPSPSTRTTGRTTALTREDWDIIRALPWNESERTLLESLFRSKNRPETRKYFPILRDSINQRFRNECLAYGLRGTRYRKSGESYEEIPFQLTKG